MKYLILLLSLGLFLTACDTASKGPSSARLGEVSLDVSGMDAAKPYFQKGLLLLHSFEYREAINQFREAQNIDPNFGMAYWGELMAYNHPLFQRQLVQYANQVFSRMGQSQQEKYSKFKTPLELDLFKSMELLYGNGTKQERDIAYNKYMEQLTHKYPNNHEVQAFYAISLLGTMTIERNEAFYDKVAAITRGILDENPKHPGALHYLIHSRDYPGGAHLAFDAAETYAKVAPDAAHALHMPSHIYIALGRWNDVINSNIDAWNASVNAKKKNPQTSLSYHSLSWLHFALLQRGEFDQAEDILSDMKRYVQAQANQEARSYMTSMQAAHYILTGDWPKEANTLEVEVNDLHITKIACHYYTQGMLAYHKKDQNKLDAIINELGKKKYTASLNLDRLSVAMCSGGGNPNVPPNQNDMDMVSIMELELTAASKKLKGQNAQALELLEKAYLLDKPLLYTFGPPTVVNPIQDVYTAALIEEKQFKKAFEVNTVGLDKHPKRRTTLEFQKYLAEQLNDEASLTEAKDQLEIIKMEKQRKAVLKI